MRAFFDSCIAIYIIESVAPWHARVNAAIRASSSLEIVVSDLVRMECRIRPLRDRDRYLLDEFDLYFERNRPIRVAPEVFELAAGLRAEHRLQTPDALHLGCAIFSACEEFWTNDRRLDRVPLPLAVRVFDDA